MNTVLLHYSYGAIIAALLLTIFLMAKAHHAEQKLLERRLVSTQERLLNKIHQIAGLQAELTLFKGEAKPHSRFHKVISVEPPKSPTRVPHTQNNHHSLSYDLIQPHWIHSGVAYSDDSRNTCSSSSSDSDSSSSSSSGGCE